MADLPDFDLLTHPLHAYSLVEASAGTGKTYSITTLVLRAVVNEGLPISQILVMTFTRKATDELKMRIGERLAEALKAIEQADHRPPSDPVLADWISAGLPAEARHRLDLAINSMDEAAIYTIHGFAQRVLQQDALASAIPLDRELMASSSELWREVIRDEWRRLVASGGPLAEHIIQRARSPEDLARSLRDVLNQPTAEVMPLPEEVVDDGLLDQALAAISALAGVWQSAWADMVKALLDGSLNAGVYKEVLLEKLHVLIASAMAQGGMARLQALNAIDNPKSSGKDQLRKLTLTYVKTKTKKGQTIPSHPLLDQFDSAIEALRKARPVLDAHWYGWLYHLVSEGPSTLRARKRIHGVCGYDDLLLDLDQALTGERGARFAERLRTRYPLALVDEFQDTDPLQWRLLRKIYRIHDEDSAPAQGASNKGATGLIMVGDPKQAIYSFRGADIFAYIAAARSVPRVSMARNYRSRPQLVKAINTLFDRPNPFRLPEIGFSAVAAHREGDDQDCQVPPGLRIRIADERHGNKGAAQAWSATAAAEEAAALLAKDVSAEKIAVLVRTNDQIEDIAECLAARNIATVRMGKTSVFASQAAEYLGRILHAVVDPGGRRTINSLLISPLLGWTLNDLTALEESKDDSVSQRLTDIRDALLRARDRWVRFGFGSMLGRLLEDLDVPTQLLSISDGRRLLTDLEHLGELLSRQSNDEAMTPEHLLTWYGDLMRDDAGDSSENASGERSLRTASDEPAVQVMTLHASKGLEFDHVICPFLWDYPSTRKKRLSVVHDTKNSNAVQLWLEKDMTDAIKAQFELEQDSGEMRLLYVALTRARETCMVLWSAYGSAEKSALGQLLIEGELEDAKDPDCYRQPLLALAQRASGCVEVRDVPPPGNGWASEPLTGELRAREFKGRLDARWRVSSYSALIAGGDSGSDPADYDGFAGSGVASDKSSGSEGEDSRFVFPAGVRSGIFLHALLENLDFALADDEDALRVEIRAQLLRNGYPAHWEKGLAQWIAAVLHSRWGADGLVRLADVSRQHRIDEMEFYFPLAELSPADLAAQLGGEVSERSLDRLRFAPFRGFMRGFVDLIFCLNERWYVVDYKSNYLGDELGDYRPERLRTAIDEHHYELQYLLYTVAVTRYLRACLPGFDYQRDFGGVGYLFLRGMSPAEEAGQGVHFTTPDVDRIAALEALFQSK